jgi:CRP-like cAMP-binding protein
VEGLERIIGEHRFFAGLNEGFRQLVCGCAKNVRFEADQYLFHEGDAADWFYLIRQGRVALAATLPGGGTTTFQTVNVGEVVGLSWLVPPYRWTFDAKALEMTRAIAMDASCLRRKCEEDHDLGYEMMKRFVPVLVERLQAAQLQMLDVYGHAG